MDAIRREQISKIATNIIKNTPNIDDNELIKASVRKLNKKKNRNKQSKISRKRNR